jgi:hypothetical protein
VYFIKIVLLISALELSHCLAKDQAMKAHEGLNLWLASFFTSTIVADRYSFTPRPLYFHGSNLPVPLEQQAGWVLHPV